MRIMIEDMGNKWKVMMEVGDNIFWVGIFFFKNENELGINYSKFVENT